MDDLSPLRPKPVPDRKRRHPPRLRSLMIPHALSDTQHLRGLRSSRGQQACKMSCMRSLTTHACVSGSTCQGTGGRGCIC
eukprot:8188978-Alexandrium_andersonii.AAC.1